MKVDKTLIVIIGVLLELSGAGNLHAQQLYYNGNIQFASGSYYFGDNTRSFYLNNDLRLNHSNYSASVNFPFVVQNSPWISYGGTGGIPTGGPQHGSVSRPSGQGPGQGMGGRRQHVDLPDTASYTQSGFGDPSVSGSYKLFGSWYDATALHINGSVKFPLADPARGFGTGAWDMGIGSSISRRFGTWFVTGNVMYWHFGDMPDLELKNSWNYGAGLGRSFAGGDWMVLGSLNGLTEIIEDVAPPVTAGLGITHQIGSRTALNINAYVGLSESSADLAIGGGWQIRLN